MPIFVNKVEISDDAVFKEMQYHPMPTREEARNEAAKALLIRELLRQKAVDEGSLSEDADIVAVDAAVISLVERDVSAPEASQTVCRRYYDQNTDRFRDKETGRSVPFEQMEERIRNYLHTRSIRHGVQSYVLNLAREARIAGFDLAASL